MPELLTLPRLRRGTVVLAIAAVLAASLTPMSARAAGTETLTGTVATLEGAAIGGALVSLYTTDEQFVDGVETDEFGEFSFAGLDEGDYVAMTFADGFVGEWFDDAASFDTATPITVPGDPLIIELAAVEPVVTNGSLEGTVTGESGVLLEPGASVELIDSDDEIVQSTPVDDTTGDYAFFDVVPGDYVVHFVPTAESVYFGEYYDDAASIDAADAVTIADAQEVFGINAELSLGGSIEGEVTGTPSGAALEGVVVQLRDATGTIVAADQADENGDYSFARLETGSYRLQFLPGVGVDYLSEWFDDASTFSEAAPIAVTRGVAAPAANAELAPYVEPVDPLALTSTPTPIIIGMAKSGSTLAVGTGTWAPAPVALTFQWLRDGEPIAGAVGTSYLLGADDVTSTITVQVTGTKAGYAPATTTSAPTEPVDPLVLWTFSPGSATISGVGTVGSTLTASTGVWTPAPEQFSYQWTRSGVAIVGATAPIYVVATSDLAKSIGVTVTGTRRHYAPAFVASAGVTIGKTLTATPVPVVSGVPTVGATLTAKAGTWKPATVTLAYQWLRDGAAISKATKTTYKLTSADLGHTVTVRVTGKKTSYTSIATVSIARTIGAAYTSTPAPVVTGYIALGEQLHVADPSWSPAPETFTYAWKVGGVVVGAGPTFEVGTAHNAKSLVVVVTGHRDGYTDVTKSSTATTIGRALEANEPSVAGVPTAGKKLTATTTAWQPGTIKYTYQWKRNGTAISTATAGTYTATATDAGKALTVSITGSKKGYRTLVATSPAVLIGKAFTTTPVPVIDGDGIVGGTLTATAGTWKPAVTGTSYQWFRSGTAIDGAIGASYETSPADAGASITVAVSGSVAGYTTVTKKSAGKPVGYAITAAPDSVAITGTMGVGFDVTAEYELSPADATISFQWLRGGSAISGATGATYRPTPSDLGKVVSVRITAAKASYLTTSFTAPGRTVEKVLDGPVPVIVPLDEDTLTVEAGDWGPAPVNLAFTWKVNGFAAGVTGTQFTPSPADYQKQITVTVFATKTGYNQASKTSLPDCSFSTQGAC
jgi:hypothetical protein